MYNINPNTEKEFFPKSKEFFFEEASGKTGIRYLVKFRESYLYMSELPTNCHTVYLSSMGGSKQDLIKLMEAVIKYAKTADYTKFYYADNTNDKYCTRVACRKFYNFTQVGTPFRSRRTGNIIIEFTADIAELYKQITPPPPTPKKEKTK